jgi:aminopeptidase-like protein
MPSFACERPTEIALITALREALHEADGSLSYGLLFIQGATASIMSLARNDGQIADDEAAP